MVVTFGVMVVWFLMRIVVVCGQGVCWDVRMVGTC